MDAKDLLRQLAETSDMILKAYIGDLEDKQLLVRSVPKANHIAWQLGHVIAGTAAMLNDLGHKTPPLPEGFAEKHTRETSDSDEPGQFFSKAEYLRLLDAMKQAALAAVEATPVEALDRPGPESMREYAPTVGSALMIVCCHPLMHSGQFVPIRRKLGKAAMF